MTDRFVRLILSIRKEDIPQDVWHQARRTLLDYLSVTLGGAVMLKDKLRLYLDSMNESGSSSVIGLHRKCSVQTAALLNGMSAHVLELDDGHRRGAVHVGATVYSALLAVAEKEGLGMEDILYGAIIGYEATIRLACAVQPGNKLRGYHATGTCGTVGAAIGIAAALGFDSVQMKSALSAAVTSAAGVLEMQEDGSEMKPLNVGRAAMDAVSAAYLGKAGVIPPHDALGGKRGFLKVMSDAPHSIYLEDSLKEFAIMGIYMKEYAACRHAHPAIEAALKLRDQLCLENIESVVVEAYRLAVAGHDHTEIKGISSAKMSIPFSVALALVKGGAGVEEFNEDNVTDDRILAVARKVRVVEDEALTALVPEKRASVLHVILKGGDEKSCRVDFPKGEPENPLTLDDVKDKFISMSALSGVPEKICHQIADEIMNDNICILTRYSL